MPKTSVGTMCYMAPEVYLGYTSYDAKVRAAAQQAVAAGGLCGVLALGAQVL